MNATLTTEVRCTNAYTTILLVRDGRVIGVNETATAADILNAIDDPAAAAGWDFNPVPGADPINPADLTDPTAWGEMVPAE